MGAAASSPQVPAPAVLRVPLLAFGKAKHSQEVTASPHLNKEVGGGELPVMHLLPKASLFNTGNE